MPKKRITIYDIAAELGFTASYVSRALNNYPSVNPEIIKLVKAKAAELNYKHNSSAANLRQGHSKIIGVIVPQVNQSFFSEAISGIEEVCFENGHSVIICQSHDSQKHENQAIEMLIRQNVDCIFISMSAETQTTEHLEEILNHNVGLIQFDRYIETINSGMVINDNREAAFNAVKQLIASGYSRIAFLGGPAHMTIFSDRKQGYLDALQEAGLQVPDEFIIENTLETEQASMHSKKLLQATVRPDAFFTVSDHQSLGVLQAARSLNISVPDELGIIGFANESFTELITPTLSSIDQHGKELGKRTAAQYFESLQPGLPNGETVHKTIVKSDLIARESMLRNNGIKQPVQK